MELVNIHFVSGMRPNAHTVKEWMNKAYMTYDLSKHVSELDFAILLTLENKSAILL